MAARRGGRWAAPVAVALLVGTPVWRTHCLDLMVDQPGASLAALALGLLAHSEGKHRKTMLIFAAVVTGLALLARWPGAILLAPAWALSIARGGRCQGLGWGAVLAGSGLVGVVALLVLAGPVVWMHTGISLSRAALAGGVSLAVGLALVIRGGVGPRGWLLGALGVTLLLAGTVFPATLWAPNGLHAGIESQLGLEADYVAHGATGRGPVAGLLHAIGVLTLWQLGPVLAWAGFLGLVLGLRQWATWLVGVPLLIQLGTMLGLLSQPDERHVLGILPLVAAFAGALPMRLPWAALRRPLAGALGMVGLAGLLMWRVDGGPGVVDAEPWHRDINLVRTVEVQGLQPTWHQSGWPWASLAPWRGNVMEEIAEALTAHYGDVSACMAYVVEPALRGSFHLATAMGQIHAPLANKGGVLRGEDVYDRPGADLRSYDGAVVFYKHAHDLPDRVARALEPIGLRQVFAGPATQVALLLRPDGVGEGWSTDGCGARFPGTNQLPMGSGFSRRTQPMLGLPD